MCVLTKGSRGATYGMLLSLEQEMELRHLTSIQASPPTRVSTSSSTSGRSSRLPRSASAAAAPISASSTRTGSTRTRRTSTTKSSLSTRSTRPSAVMRASTGSSSPCTSTARAVASPRPAKRAVALDVGTNSTRPRRDGGRRGRGTTRYPFGATARYVEGVVCMAIGVLERVWAGVGGNRACWALLHSVWPSPQWARALPI